MEPKTRTEYVMEITQYLLKRAGDPYTAAEIFEVSLEQLGGWSIMDAAESQDWDLTYATIARVEPLTSTVH
jgi:hypothetical protein